MISRRFLLSAALASGAARAMGGDKPVNLVPVATTHILPGIEILIAHRLALLKGKRIGLVTNQTGVNRKGEHAIDLLRKAKVTLVALFGPEHGLRGEAQAGDKVASGKDAATGLSIHSLYGATKEPTAEMLKGVDMLLFDMQDVGARFYTYPSTLLLVMRAAAKANIPLVVLDRPNPLGGELIEGPLLQPPYASFVGMYAMPVVHGMTMGELARMFAAEEKLKLKLTVIPMQGWHRDTPPYFFWDLSWTPPSPNMPTPKTAAVYPGTALFEGTNISEGRGSEKPFEYIGAPFIDSAALIEKLTSAKLPGVAFEPIQFIPTFSKFTGELCHGLRVIPTDRKSFRPVLTGVALVKAVHDLYPDQFQFRTGAPSYFDQLAGVGYIREDILAGKSVATIEAKWLPDVEAFRARRRSYLLY